MHEMDVSTAMLTWFSNTGRLRLEAGNKSFTCDTKHLAEEPHFRKHGKVGNKVSVNLVQL